MMKLGLKLLALAMMVVLFAACGDGEKSKKKNNKTETNGGNAVQNPAVNCQPTTTAQSANTGGMGDLFGQILKNPALLQDVLKLFGGALGQGGENGGLGSLLKMLQGGGGATDLTKIEDLFKSNPDLAAQVQGILSNLNSGTGTTLALQATCGAPASTTTPTTTVN